MAQGSWAAARVEILVVHYRKEDQIDKLKGKSMQKMQKEGSVRKR